MLFWLLILGLITYFIVQRSVASITRTPVWILWLVMMTPALIWTGWVAIQGEERPIPLALLLAPFFFCPLLYWWLIQLGRRETNPQVANGTETAVSQSSMNPTVEPATVRPITQEEEAQLRNCFPWSIYYLKTVEYRPQALICRGNLRADSEVAYQTVRENIERIFGDRFLVMFQEGLNSDPFFALVPNPQARAAMRQKQERLTRPFLALALLVITLFTTTLIGSRIAGISPEAVEADSSVLLQGLPYALSLMLILGVHEMGHYLTARFYKIRTTLPYFIPIPFFLGTFGAFIQMRSPVPNRKVLFDVAIAGPLAGFVVTVPLLMWGLAHSEVVNLSAQSGMLNFDSFDPKFSLLLAVLSKWALGSQLTATQAINLHPVAVSGFLGVIVTAFNLVPVGQLDGGHIVHAMFGQRTGGAIGQVARLLLLILSLVQPGFLFWAIFLFFMPMYDEPALNDVTQLNNQRDVLGLLALALLVLIILPAPRFVTQLLGM